MARIEIGINDLDSQYPELAREFYTEKNLPLTPNSIACKSNKKVWWLCNNGHSYQSTVANRTVGQGCPYCSGRKILVGYNDLASTNPEVAQEFDLEKNFPLTPQDISAGMGKKVWWTCRKGHSYRAYIYSRVGAGTGCPQCSRETATQRASKAKLKIGINDLATCYPKLAKEFDNDKNTPLTAGTIACKSNKKVWWLCNAGHSYLSTPNRRVLLNNGCPYCSGRSVIVGQTDLATTNPELVKDFDFDKNYPLTPQQLSKGSDRKVWWLCDKGHSYESVIASRARLKTGCPYCSNIIKKIEVGFNDLSTTNPDLTEQFDYERNCPFTPQDFTKGSNTKVWWICSYGHNFYSSIANRTNLKRGCPICARKTASDRQFRISLHKGENDLQSQFPEIAKEFDFEKNYPVTPEQVTYGSDQKMWWLCSLGHSYICKVADRSKGKSCPYCSGQKILIGFNDLATTHPKLAKEFDYEKNYPLVPQNLSKGTKKKIWWLCSNGHSFQIRVADRRRGRGCPYCTGSTGERFVYEYLTELGIMFEIEKKFINYPEVASFPYDIFLPEHNVIIEVDGLQHFDKNCSLFSDGNEFELLIKHCNIKNRFCLDNGIAILRIPFKNVSEKFEVECKNIIDDFLKTNLVPNEILEFYQENDISNYRIIAKKMNSRIRKQQYGDMFK